MNRSVYKITKKTYLYLEKYFIYYKGVDDPDAELYWKSLASRSSLSEAEAVINQQFLDASYEEFVKIYTGNSVHE